MAISFNLYLGIILWSLYYCQLSLSVSGLYAIHLICSNLDALPFTANLFSYVGGILRMKEKEEGENNKRILGWKSILHLFYYAILKNYKVLIVYEYILFGG